MFSIIIFQTRGSFSKLYHFQKFIHLLKATHILYSFLELPYSNCPLISSSILQPALIELSRSEKALVLFGSFSVIDLKASLLCIDFFILLKYFQCSIQAFLISSNCYQLGSQLQKAAGQNRYLQFYDFLRMFNAILSVVYWNLIMKYTKTSSLIWVIVNSFLIFQNSLAIQLAIIVTFFKQLTYPLISEIFNVKRRDSHSSRQEALYLSSQMRVRPIILPIVRSKLELISIILPQVCCFMRVSVLCALESMKGWKPLQMKYRRQPADHTSHLNEYFQFLSCQGEAQMGVPLSREKLSIFDISVVFTLLAHPKSATFIIIPLPISMFQGLRSRWKTPLTFMTMNA